MDKKKKGNKKEKKKGLIVNEKVNKTIKKDYQEIETKRKVVRLQEKKESRELMVADNGNGIGDPGKLKKSDSFGMKLLRRLVEQVNGTMTLRQGHGTTFIIEIHICYDEKQRLHTD